MASDFANQIAQAKMMQPPDNQAGIIQPKPMQPSLIDMILNALGQGVSQHTPTIGMALGMPFGPAGMGIGTAAGSALQGVIAPEQFQARQQAFEQMPIEQKAFEMASGFMAPITIRGKGWIENAIKKYGTTVNPNESGFILPQGQMLNLKRSSQRIEHNAISDVNIMPNVQSKKGKLIDNYNKLYMFMDETDSIRMAAGKNPIDNKNHINFHLVKQPTKDQFNTIKEVLPYYDKLFIDITKPNTGLTAETMLNKTWKSTIIDNPTINKFKAYLNKTKLYE